MSSVSVSKITWYISGGFPSPWSGFRRGGQIVDRFFQFPQGGVADRPEIIHRIVQRQGVRGVQLLGVYRGHALGFFRYAGDKHEHHGECENSNSFFVLVILHFSFFNEAVLAVIILVSIGNTKPYQKTHIPLKATHRPV